LLLNLLPGLRELRAPLAAGYVWLASVGILFGRVIPHERPARGLLADIWSLADIVGSAAILAAVTFVAFLVGSLLEVDPEGRWGSAAAEVTRTRMKRVKGPRVGERSEQWIRTPPLSVNGTHYLTRFFHQKGWLEERPWSHSWAASEGYPRWLSSRQVLILEFIDEVPQLATRLQVRNPDLYGKYDRLVTEAALRMTLAAPVCFLVIVLGARADLALAQRLAVVGSGVALGLLLLWHGAGRNLAARDVLVQALVIGEVEWQRVGSYESTSDEGAPAKPEQGEP
jgi:hypothetical protein